MQDDQELRSARRIAAASDQRRRRVERAMHDGVQQQMALMALKLGLLRRDIHSDPDSALALCQELSETLASAQRELRELAHWVFPAVLENEGLVAALDNSVGRHQLRVEVHAEAVGRYSREVEATAYFCCLEALEQVARIADSGAEIGGDGVASVTLSEHDGVLSFAIRGNGHCAEADPSDPYGGLQHVADRLTAMGGSLELRAVDGSGATVIGRLPARGDAG